MARYKIAHDLNRTWLCRDGNGFKWGDYENATLFPNYKEAKRALDTMPEERRMYNAPYKPAFMKFYDSEKHLEQEREYLKIKRFYRDT